MKKITNLGLLLAFGLILSYIESLIPFGFGIPGIKLGLANFAILLCLYTYSGKDAFVLNISRIMLSGFLFGNLYTIIYSLAGGMFSFVAMYLLKKTDKFTMKGTSVIGGVFHNVGQIIIAAFVVSTKGIFYFIPYLIVAGVFSGFIIGVIAQQVMPHIITLKETHQ